MRDRRRPAVLIASLAAAALTLAGCGDAKVGGLVPVAGKVTLDGGPWPKPGKINFLPTGKGGGENTNLRPASADFDTSGAFTVSSFEGNPGLYPGEYWVSVECWEEEPGMANPNAQKALAEGKKPVLPAGKSAVPKKYQDANTSGLSLQVSSDKPVEANFDIKTK